MHACIPSQTAHPGNEQKALTFYLPGDGAWLGIFRGSVAWDKRSRLFGGRRPHLTWRLGACLQALTTARDMGGDVRDAIDKGLLSTSS